MALRARIKLRIEVMQDAHESEVVIRCREIDDTVRRIQQFVQEQGERPSIVFYRDNEEYYFPFEDVLFFETSGESVYAHTADAEYRIKLRLYELEDMLPRQFVRVAKSTILNTAHIYSITRNVTASSAVQFARSHKVVYISRLYYKELRTRLDERVR